MHGHETEIKLRVSSPSAVRRRLRELGFGIRERNHFERNVLFDFPDQRLRKARSLVRLRREGRRNIVTFKGAPLQSANYKIRREIETEVGDVGPMRGILESLGLRETFRYEKFRTTYAPGLRSKVPAGGLVVLDETPIGNFLELEGPKHWIDTVARRLGYGRGDYIPASYVSLYYMKCAEQGRKPGNMIFGAGK